MMKNRMFKLNLKIKSFLSGMKEKLRTQKKFLKHPKHQNLDGRDGRRKEYNTVYGSCDEMNFMFTNLEGKDDESKPMTIKAEPIKEVIGRSKHTMDLSAHDLSSSILIATSRNKRETEEVDEILRQAKTLEV